VHQKFRLLLTVLLVALTLAPGWLSAQEPSPDYAILIVGDEGDTEMKDKEKALIKEMAKSLSRQQKIPIYSYHFNKERERAYCEKKLNILREDLLFVGIVSLKDRVPRKVMYRLDRITNPARSALDIVARADELTGVAEATPSPDATVAATASPAPAGSPQAAASPGAPGAWRVQLGSFTQLKGAQELVDRLKTKGYDAKVDKLGADTPAPQFKVWIGTFTTKEDATQAQAELKNDGFKEGFVTEAGKP
jgi:hypothetical protein